MPQNLKKNLTNNLKPKQILLSNKKSVYQDIFIDRSNLQKKQSSEKLSSARIQNLFNL